MKHFIVKEESGSLHYDDVLLLNNLSSLKLIEHDIRLKILKLLAKKPMYPAEIAKELKLHEQKIYYHIKQLVNANVIEVVEKKEIRGTTAKKFAPKNMNFAVCLENKWKPFRSIAKKETNKEMNNFLDPFVVNGKLDADIVVGSPDPHGVFKARARDGHYAIDLALFLGNICNNGRDFSVKLDVDVDLKNNKRNLILVGGPVTNLVLSKINEFLPAKFSDKKPWGIVGKKDTYTDDNIGIIARFQNPFSSEHSVLAFAGIRFSGTKAAVIAFTRHSKLVLNRFSGQKEFFCIVHGFDVDGDGKIDSVEVLE